MEQEKKILVIGSYNVGLTIKTSHLPVWGETLVGKGFKECHGGKGSNQAVAAARLGGNVTFIGSLGNDNYGDNGLMMLESERVNTTYIVRESKKSTGVGFILLNNEKDNCIIIDKGANEDLTPDYIESLETEIINSDIVIFQLEIPIETVKKGMEIAKKHNKLIIFNPAPADQDAINLLSLATIVNPNETELLILSGEDTSRILSKKETIFLAEKLLEKGPETIIVTRGEKSTLVIEKSGIKEINIKSTVVKDTTGAGDAFTGGLAIALAEGKDILKAVRFASLVGSYTCMMEGVIPALPSQEQLLINIL